MDNPLLEHVIGGLVVAVALVFVYKSFYGMRIPREKTDPATLA
jgi:hypothetical protein